MKKTEVRLGITPILKRLAYSYLTKGFGKYLIKHPQYDEVEVKELYPWRPNPSDPEEHGAGIAVIFLKGGEKKRWVEFGVRYIGGGGHPAIHLLDK